MPGAGHLNTGVAGNSDSKASGEPSLQYWTSSADRFQVMVASFSEAEDQLSQWRGYSGSSSGISVSLNLVCLRPPAVLETAAVFAPCIYDDAKKIELLTYALSRIIDTVEIWSADVKAAIEADSHLLSKISTPMELGPPHVAGPDFGTRLKKALQKAISI